MSDHESLLAANQAFYAAFMQRDVAAMERLWARSHPVACIHPGWDALNGREAVMASWRSILANPDSPRIGCANERAFFHPGVAWVICHESIGRDTVLVATNLFVREDGAWRMVHHQATALAVPVTAVERVDGPLH